MQCRRWPVLALLALLVSSSIVGTVSAQDGLADLGIVRSYTPGDLEAKASDLAADGPMGYAILTRGDDGVLLMDLEKGKVREVVIPSSAWTVTVEIANEWLMATTVTGRLHGIDPDTGKVSWSKTALDGNLRVTAVSQKGYLMAFVGIDTEFRMVISVLSLPDLSKMNAWSRDIPDDMAFTTPTCAAWLPHDAVGGWSGETLVIGTNEGQVLTWRGSGEATTVVDLDEEVVGMEWDTHTAKLVVATRKGRVYMVDVGRQLVASQFSTDFAAPRTLVSFDYHVDARRMAVGGSDGQIEVWDMADLHMTQTIRYHNFSLADMAWVNRTHMVSAGRFATMLVWGPDTDSDGRADEVDAFPADRTEWEDTDDDGVGDNRDMFPEDPKEWWDTDNDGVGDNGDLFPKDPTEWADADGDGVGDNGDFIPNLHNVVATVMFLALVAVAAALPVARMAHVKRKGQRNRRERVMAWLEELGVTPAPGMDTPAARERLDRAWKAFKVREAADPPRLLETVEAYDTTVLNTAVALQVQEEIMERGGVGADAAMSRSVRLRGQLQELDEERERLDAICRSFWEVQDQVDREMRAMWPGMVALRESMTGHEERVQRLDNTLEQFRKGSVIKIGGSSASVSRGAYVVAAKEVRLRGSERPLGVRVGVPPKPEVLAPEPDERGEATPLSVTPPIGRLRTRQAMLIRDDTADLVVTVDNTLAEDVDELAVEFNIAGDRLRHKGPHKVELGTLVTGRSAGATFQMRVNPPPPADEEPGELTRVLVRVTGVVGSRKVRQELPAKATSLISAGLERPPDLARASLALERPTVGRQGVRFPNVPSNAVLNALEFPHGMLPLMDGSMHGMGTWRIFASRTDADEPLMALVAVDAGPEWVDLLVEVRGPPRFPSRELAEELVDSARFAVLSDRRLRLRGADRPLPAERVRELADLVAQAYIGAAEAGSPDNGEDVGEA